MTGLDLEKELIIEIAVIVSDSDLKQKFIGPSIAIQCPEERLLAMDEWCTKTHSESGLVQRVRDS
jgi:oligoribonuclease